MPLTQGSIPIDFREGEEEGEKYWYERDINRLLSIHIPGLGTELAT